MKMQHFLLDIISFNKSHNTINITNEIISALAEFKIKEKSRTEWSVSSEQSSNGAINTFLKKINQEKSRLSGIQVFGFDIEILHQVRIEKSSIVKTTIIDKRKRPLGEVVSASQQNKRYASFGRDVHKKIKQLIFTSQNKANRTCDKSAENQTKFS
ncbi:hypothetical protein RhiirC2_721213 [Rhizophagus irregularis]|uniref:Uncharacterized protein n=1 Tax=Rhizophagus irregularis TaxID=588596 RepID=A0A2N1M759_9GLOM|nr:hypothetical protein RhiirC2_721213 [Rhizophagus irregularis]